MVKKSVPIKIQCGKEATLDILIGKGLPMEVRVIKSEEG